MGGDEPSEAHNASEDAQNQRIEADTTASYREDESMLDDGTGDLAGSTPRAQPSTKSRPQFAKLGSPYEELRRELKGDSGDNPMPADDSDFDIVPHQHTTRLPNMSMTPRSSLSEAGLADDDVFSTARKTKDPLLHRVLDKNYRIQATPHKPTGVSPIKWKVTEKPQDKGKAPAWGDDSQMSSPDMTIPTLRSAAFMSPAKFPAGSRPKPPNMTVGPRTPGVSVQTPSMARKTKDVYAETSKERGRQRDEITWESDEEDVYGGMSPPKTIQFALPPSKLLQTPGKVNSIPLDPN
jgi:DASH complex subunit ASK1